LASQPGRDEIATVLSGQYGFPADALVFIVNYDIKYRLGSGPEEGHKNRWLRGGKTTVANGQVARPACSASNSGNG
jgi:hypothetical protein